MEKSSLPTVGFDRFVKFSWAEQALDLAISQGEPEILRLRLMREIEGEESARKTYNLLNNLWLNSFLETEDVRMRALILATQVDQNYRIALHWGMAIANFGLFQRTTSIIGKLVRLQGGFKAKEIRQRIAEQYGNQGTVLRAVSRIIQSLCNWTVLEETERFTYLANKDHHLTDGSVLSWMILAAISSQRNRPILISELLRLPELFPFAMPPNGLKIVRESSYFSIIREGLNEEYLVVN